MREIKMTATFPAEPMQVYQAWMDSRGHSAMTGSPAMVGKGEGSKFSAWDGYIEGTTVKLVPGEKIVQKWRSSDFPEGSPDSDLEITLSAEKAGTKLTLLHTNIPDDDDSDYEEGWRDFYFEPMQAYFKK